MEKDFFAPEKALQKKMNSQESSKDKFEIVERYAGMVDEHALIQCMEGVLQKAEILGEGKNAHVFNLPGFKSLCVKKIFKTPSVVINNIEQEAEIQQEVFSLGIQTPRYFRKLRDKDTRQEYLVMEQIKGHSIGDFLEKLDNEDLQDSKFHQILSVLDRENFMTKLRDSVAELHKHNIFHKDLHTGNVMINEKGDPVIIDWGASGKEYLNNEDEIYQADGKVWNPFEKKYVRGMMKTKNDRVELDNIDKSMLKLIKFKNS